jgi:hypothetical protein
LTVNAMASSSPKLATLRLGHTPALGYAKISHLALVRQRHRRSGENLTMTT